MITPEMSEEEVIDEGVGEESHPERTVTVKRQDTVYKGHWKDKKDIKNCSGCDKPLTKIQSRHHCRICGDVYCYRCTRFSRRLLPDRIPDPGGKKYKVCRSCNADISEAPDDGRTRSWTNEFHSMNLEFKNTTKREAMTVSTVSLDNIDDDETDSRGILRVLSVRGRLIDVFNEDLRKPTSDKIIEKGKKAAKKGGFHKIFQKKKKQDPQTKQPVFKTCEDCKTNLSIDGIKRDCRVCGLNFCDYCCGKDVVIKYQLGEDTDIYDPEIIIDGNDNEEPTKYRKSKRYRVCRFCRSQYQSECLLREVSSLTRILIQIQKEIRSIEEEEENEQELAKLQNEYMQYYRKVIALETNTYTQARLKQNVQNAMREFYIQHVSRDSIRLSRKNLNSQSEDTPNAEKSRSNPLVGNLRRSLKKVRSRISLRQNSRSSINNILCDSTSQLSLKGDDKQKTDVVSCDHRMQFSETSLRNCVDQTQRQGNVSCSSSEDLSSADGVASTQFTTSAVVSRSETTANVENCGTATTSGAVAENDDDFTQNVTPNGSTCDLTFRSKSADEISQISASDSVNSREGARNSRRSLWRAVNKKLRKFRSVSELFVSKSHTDLASAERHTESSLDVSEYRDSSITADTPITHDVVRKNGEVRNTSDDFGGDVVARRTFDLQNDDIVMCDDFPDDAKPAQSSGFSRVRRLRKSWRNAFRRISEKGNRLRDLKILHRKSVKHRSGDDLRDVTVYRSTSLQDIELYAMAT